MPAKFFKLRCNFGTIDQILGWGVNQLGSFKNQEETCFADVASCGSIGTKSHPMYKRILACVGKEECLIEELAELLPVNPHAECPLFKTSSLFVSFQCS